ncbi:T9SS type A sorting domain-containing protein [Psychroserpens sp. S379A]|uniref:T9SS type A sorting domain-containing protein n=1 Tax=Psychroserpens sp. S379A TaxID=3415137 RepID=UPI003C7E060F
MSLDGNIVAIGAGGNDGNGVNSGHVRVYENQGGNWVQIGNDIDGEAAGDASEIVSLSADGSTVAIGSYTNSGNGVNSGHVRVYENQGGNWIQLGNDINGETAGDESGLVSLSADGSTVAIGSQNNDGVNGPDSGHVRIFNYQGGNWVQIGNDIDGEAAYDLSAWSLSLSSDGSTVAIGAIGNAGFRGHVRVYKNVSGTWTQIGQDIDGEMGSSDFGWSLELSSDGTILAIGANTAAGGGPTDFGVIRVFGNQGGNWVQIGQTIEGEASGDDFGIIGLNVTLSSDGSVIAFTVNNYNLNTIFVRVFGNQNGSWIQIGDNIEVEADEWSRSISLSSDASVIAIGEHLNDANGIDSGRVQVFSLAPEISLLQVVDDILGNGNGITITAAQLNRISGVSGAIEGVDYSTALQNGTFSDPNNPTPLEIQAIINQVNATLSVDENHLSSFQLYPNPAKEQFTIQLNDGSILKQITIYSTLGKEVLRSKELEVNTSTLTSGTYIIEIKTTQGKSSKKLIIE